MFHRFSFSRHFFLPAGFPSTVPEGGELPITAGGMTEGNGTCGKQNTTPTTVPEGGEQEKEGMRFAPFGDDEERAPADPQVT